MKILLVSSFFPPTHTAGTETRTLSYALELQRLRHEVQMVCAGKWNEGAHYWNGYVDEIYRQIPVRRIHLNWALAPDPNRFLYCNSIVERDMGRWLEQWKPDLVHITSCYTLSASVIQAAKDRQVPVVLTLTDYWFICPRVNLLRGDRSLCDGRRTSWDCIKCMLWDARAYRWPRLIMPEEAVACVLKWVSKHPSLSRLRGLRGMVLDMEHRKTYLDNMLNLADCVTAPSNYLRAVFTNCGVSVPIKVVYSGHDLAWRGDLPQKKPSSMIRFGYVGQIIFIKGLHILLSAFVFDSLQDRASLSIFGDPNKSPTYAHRLQTQVAGEEETVRFHGAFCHQSLGQVLSEIDILVVPSLWHENNPRVIQEAFASRTPVIASNVGGISEFVRHEVNGLLFERGNVEDLARHLRRVISEPGLLARLEAGIPRVKRIEEEVAELVSIYRALIGHTTP